MKFTDGGWHNREGVDVYGAVELRDLRIEKNRVTVYVSPAVITNRGQVIDSTLLTVEFTAPRKDILGVRAYHIKGDLPEKPRFTLYTESLPLEIEDANDAIIIRSGKLAVALSKQPFSMTYTYDGTFLARSDLRDLALLTTREGNFFRGRINISVDELFYGLGERFSAFVKNGQQVDIWNEDGGTFSEIAYKNIPFILSNRGYGIFVNHPEKVSFEIGSELVSKMQFSVPGEALDYYFIGGGTMQGALSNYTALTGKPSLPPAWSFGLWLTTSFTTDYDEQTVMHFVNGMFERDIPLSVFHFDCFWMKEYEWCNFTWDEAVFPDPQGMLERIKAKGPHICVWINPYIGQKSPLFDEAAKLGYLLCKPNGSPFQWDKWQPGLALVDFTNPDGVIWYQNKLKALLDMGVDCFKTDFGERIPTDVVYHDGSDPQGMHNYYTYLYNKTVFDLLVRERGTGEAVLFARSATVGGQQFPVHWGGDSTATYNSMGETLRGGLSLALGGFGFWSHDISGFDATATPDLYKRWVAFGMFSTHSRLHGSASYRVPWLFGDEAVEVLRFFTRCKHRLMPYLFAQAVRTCETGIPMMRPMVLAYPGDRACAYLDRQYMLGEKLLVAPVFREDGVCEYYLPKGIWTHLLSGESIEGGRFITGTFDYFSLPVYVAENTLLPMGREDRVSYDYTENIDIHAYALEDAEVFLTDEKGAVKARVWGKRDNDSFVFTVEGKLKNCSLLLHEGGTIITLQLTEGKNKLILKPPVN
jgi:alpha-D-xyloside xylohydrolase